MRVFVIIYCWCFGWGCNALTLLRGFDDGVGDRKKDSVTLISVGGKDVGTSNPSSFPDALTACRNCISFFPEKKGGKQCHYGPCNFRALNSQSYGGIINHGARWESPPAVEFCLSMDPIVWFHECAALVSENVKNVPDVIENCVYEQQLFFHLEDANIPVARPKKIAFSNFYSFSGGSQCGHVIPADGKLFYDDKNVFDADGKALSGCCNQVHEFFTCIGNMREIFMSDTKGQDAFDTSTADLVEAFREFCVPFFRFPEKKAFCIAYSQADSCRRNEVGKACETCIANGGKWCALGCNKGDYCATKCPPKVQPLVAAPPATPPPSLPPPAEALPDNWWWKVVYAGDNTAERITSGYLSDIRVTQGNPPVYDGN